MKFGEKLKKLRAEHDLTQDQLAEKLYVTRTAVSKWETDKGMPGIDSLICISRFFDVTVDELISDDDIATTRTLDAKRSRTMYIVALVFLGVTVLFTLLFYFLQNIYFVIGSTVGVVGYFVFAILTKRRDKPFAAGKVILPYIIARIALLIIVVAAVVTTVIKLAQ